MSDRGFLSIGEVLSLLRPEFPDLTISKIRFLESQGLLNPERTPSGYRKFYEADVERLRWILVQQREQYLPLKVIKGKLGRELESAPSEREDVAGETARHDTMEVDDREGARANADRPRAEVGAGPFDTAPTGVSLTVEELAKAAQLTSAEVEDLERFGLVQGRAVGGTTFYDDDALVIAKLAGGFLRFGVEARHLRMYKTAAEREAGFFEQLIMPLVKQRNPAARAQALDTLRELGRLGQGLRGALLRQALRDYTGA